MHRLLRRQLRRHLAEGESLPESVERLLEAVSAAYEQSDDDRRLLERSLELTSRELMQRNRELQADVEGRVRAEQALRDREAQTRAILAALPDLLLVVSPHGEVREIHSVGRSFLPEPISDLQGRPLAEVLPAQLLGPLVPAIREATVSQKPQRLELSLSEGNRRKRYEARLTVSVVGDVVMLIRDQTERVRMVERLRVADRMASVGTLAAGVAHELNNPLAYVLGNIELMRQELNEPALDRDEMNTLVADALDGARRMRTITQDLRTFSQPHSEVVESVDPRAVIDSALKMAGTEIRHRAVLRREYRSIPPVHAEASKLGQVFLNLVINAVQALPVGEASSNEIVLRTMTDSEGYAVVEVCDTGPGIPVHLQSRIFEPFVTSKPRGVGTGLGLSICHNIVTSLGGHISVHQRPDRGTIFRVRLPPSGKPISRRRPTAGNLPMMRDRTVARQRVLIIDDDKMVGNTLRRLLSNRDVMVARSGREGVEVLRANDQFDVVLCDLMMPEISGMDVYDLVNAERPDLAARFVFMTGGAFTDRARAFLDKVGNPRLEKPFDAKTLHAVLAGEYG
ncbi:MAG: ATP-binding protein [Myxococcota bacterium]